MGFLTKQFIEEMPNILLIFSFALFIQISPGKLSNPHKDLEGINNCLKCHSVGKKITNDKCLDCHSEIKRLIQLSRGYHFYVREQNCAQCHKEHFGREFKLINFDEKSFNHGQTGFKLDGAHAKLKCYNCHNKKFIKSTKKEMTFLGLDTSCLSCHKDEHKGQLSKNCVDCHSFENWGSARASFNHDRANFKLTGLHKRVDCYACHPRKEVKGETFVIFKGIMFSSCSNCHKDFHQGKFGKCEKCHLPDGWALLKVKFDHGLTNFKLEGKHNLLECKQCHNKVKVVKSEIDYVENFKLKHTLCVDCHKDYHNGVFSDRKSRGDCADCHILDGFIPVAFSIDRHNMETRFKLSDSHMSLPCVVCHKRGNSEIFKWGELICQTCHSDNHANQFATENGKTFCDKCHKTTKWNDLKFNHDETNFKLVGKHKFVACDKCHNEKISLNSAIFVKYIGTPKECASCHKDIHMGQFSDCSRCHTPDTWVKLTFDHNVNSRFKLTGAHEKVECLKCHKTETVNGINFIRYKPTPINCESCHAS
jgi:hypothetical protein